MLFITGTSAGVPVYILKFTFSNITKTKLLYGKF